MKPTEQPTMTVLDLRVRWAHALDTADAAIIACQKAHSLPPDFCAHELEHIRSERRWLAELERRYAA
jgi:hypothetical protein